MYLNNQLSWTFSYQWTRFY